MAIDAKNSTENKTPTLKDIQSRLLRETLDYLGANSPFYKNIFKNGSVNPGEISSISDIATLPLTSKEDIQRDNWSLLSVDKSKISEVVSTTGTTGEPVFIALTESDISRLVENERRQMELMGIGPGDSVQVAVAMDSLFIAGLAYYLGVRAAGAAAIRSGSYNPRRQLALLRDLKPKVLIAVPSFMLHMAKEATKAGFDLDEIKPRSALLIGETVRNEDFSSNNLGKMVEDTWNCSIFSTYGITEGAVAFSECAFKKGFHSHPDFVYAEVVGENGNVLPPGEIGELVITTFQVEGMPLLRYRTGDITFISSEPCECGDPSERIGPIVGRRSHRFKVKGTTVYPGAIKNGLMSVEGLTGYQIVVFAGEDGTDSIKVKVGSESQAPAFKEEVRSAIREHARFAPEVEVVSPPELEKLLLEGGRRKRQTFVDLR